MNSNEVSIVCVLIVQVQGADTLDSFLGLYRNVQSLCFKANEVLHVTISIELRM